MNELLNKSPLIVPASKRSNLAAVADKGHRIMEGLLLNQYQNSPNLKEYFMAFISELDFLFEQIEEVHSGRFLETAIGEQLDVIGIILQQTRAVILPTLWFGFAGALDVEGMADEATPAEGGLFRDENSGAGAITPLSDMVYRRVLTAKAFISNRDSADLSLAYYVVSILLGRVPATFDIQDQDSGTGLPARNVKLVVSAGDVSLYEVQLILYMSRYFIPAGITFTIERI